MINRIRELDLDDVYVVNELLSSPDDNTQTFFRQNDLDKISKYRTGTIIIDIGIISILSYNQCLEMINKNKELESVIEWADEYFENMYAKATVKTRYLKRHNHQYLLRYVDELELYGSV